MLAQAERRHQLEHGHLDVAWRLTGTLAMEKRGQHRVGQVQPRDLVRGDARRIDGRAVAHLEQAGEARCRLDHVVVGRLAGIAPMAAEADRGGIHDPRIDFPHSPLHT